MKIKSIVDIFKQSCLNIGVNCDTGTTYHLNQKIDDNTTTTDLPFVYLFRPIEATTSRIDSSSPFVDSHTLSIAYFHATEIDENSEDYEEAQEAGDEILKKLVNEFDNNDLLNINETSGTGFVKYIDSYVGRTLSITIESGDNFDYCYDN